MKKTFKLEDLDCANCASKMENAIRKIEGVDFISVSFMQQKLVIDVDEERFANVFSEVEKIIKKIDSDVIIVK